MTNPDLFNDLSKSVSGEVRFDKYTRALYSTDASSYQLEPLGVVLPRTNDDVAAIIEIAKKHNAQIIARGGGSGLAGQAIGHGIIVDFSKYMNQILEINAQEGWARVQPGVVCDALLNAAKKHGYSFGTEPASSNRATIGGMIANNSTGAHSVMYGMTADHILEADVYLSDGLRAKFSSLDANSLNAKLESQTREGELYRGIKGVIEKNADAIKDRFPKTWRRASGYSLNYMIPPHGYVASRPAVWYSSQPYPPAPGFNLAKLLAGSEGTLAITLEAKLNLVKLPKMTGLCVLHFDSIAATGDATPLILECQPAAVELIDKMMIDLTRAIPAYARQLTFIQGDPAAILVVEFYGDTESEIVSQIEKLEAKMIAHNVTKTFVRALTAQQQKDVWGVRVVGLGVLQSMRGDSKPVSFMEDVAVPVDKLGDYIRFVEKMFKEHGVDSAYYAHASAGCLHIRPVINFKEPKDIEKVRSMGKTVLGIVQQMGGAMTGEHGDGLSRSMWNGRLFGEQLYNAFREVKQTFDPDYRFNPNKIIDAPDFMENLRHKPLDLFSESKVSDFGRHREMSHSKGLTTYLNFDREMGFVRAIEQCNGAGVCRKVDGTMCPSYMATRDEEHSTRGRANSLRNALSGVLPPEEFFSPRMFDVLDLCLECKACKAECPSGVDMAKIKYEYLSHYHEVHGVPLRARLFANINALSNLAHYFAPLVNFGMSLGVTRWVNEKLLGISSHRTLPAFVFKTFRDQAMSGERRAVSNERRAASNQKSVVLFADTFTNYNHPSIGMAALKVLEAAGYNVLMPNHGCCGRPMISKGLLWQAKEQARKNVEALYPYVEKGIPIIGLEPSCLLTFNDEYVDLLPDDPRVKQIAAKTMLIEEFLAGAAERGELKIKWKDEKRKVLVHGHCYQKAITGTAALRKMLSLPGWDVSEINSGCCGMAGSFGYEAEHFDISMKIGGERLFPAVKNAEANTYVVASGMSCRHQIEHGTERKPLHPIELLAEGVE